MNSSIAIEWVSAPTDGRIEVNNGRLISASVTIGSGSFDGSQFRFFEPGRCRIELVIETYNMSVGADPTMVHVQASENPFAFFARDVNLEFPILIPIYGVAVLHREDQRS